MNNCYLWMREQQEETNVEEQDRSLHVVEVCLPTVRQPFQLFDQMLDDEELPELSLSEPDSNSKNNDPPSSERSSSSRQQNAQRDARNASGIPALVASSSQSLMRTSHRKKFLSRSHNSLVFRPPDYSKVESKVKKYIVSMREQQQQRRQQAPKNRFDPAPVPTLELAPSSGLMLPEDDVNNLKRQLIDQDAMVEVLQEDHDRLLLHNARLQNMLEEMRTKIRILHAQQQHQRQPQKKERRTNSPLQPEIDKNLSSSQESFSSSTKGSVGPLAAAIQLGLTYHQHEALSITPSSYLDLPTFGQFNRKTEGDDTSSCDSNSWNSNNKLHQHFQPRTNKATSAPVGLDKEHIIKPALSEEPLQLENNDSPDVLLLTQLKEITIAALEVRDQTRTIIRQINLTQCP